jgi:predicted nucleic acid-binding protein
MTARILIDTCGWIDFLRGKSGQLGDIVEQALTDDSAVMCSVSIAELLQGLKRDVKGNKEKQQLEFLFESVPCLSVLDEDWSRAGHALRELRATGVTLPLTDALIASVAKRHDVAVLTVDTHFQHLAVRLVRV